MSQQDRYEAAAVCSSLKTVAAMLGGTAVTARARRPVLQDWLCDLTLMQQSVVISAIRGCDGVPKRHKAKPLVLHINEMVDPGLYLRSLIITPAARDVAGMEIFTMFLM